MRRCVVNSAGANNYAALWIESSNVVVEDCRIHDNAAAGIYLSGGGLAPVLRRVEVDRNGGWAVVQSTLDMNPAYEGLSIHDNGRDAVYVEGYGTTGRDVVLDGGAVGGVPYVLASSWAVGSGRALTVTAGTAVRFGDNVYLQVDGRLVAEGGATAPITFTTASTTTVAPGRWYYIRFTSGSSGVMRRCVVNSAGANNYAALWIESSNVVVEDCRIHDNAAAGIYLNGGGLAPVLRRVEVDRNGGWAVVQSTLDMNPAYEGLSIHDNGRDAVYVGGYGTTGRDVVLDGGAVGGVPYVLASSWAVGSGRALTVTAGTAVRFGDNVYLQVNGRLVAEGGATAPITFTTASTTTVAPGRWYYIRFRSGSSGVMRRCVVNSAGANNYAALWIESSNVVVEDCRIHDNAAAGIYLNGGGLAPVLRRVEVDRNGGWAVVQSTLDMNPAYEGLSIHDNGRDAVYVGGMGRRVGMWCWMVGRWGVCRMCWLRAGRWGVGGL
jgi:urease beta subunit